MDHVGGLPYYFSQRMFQKMGTGKCVCHEVLADPLTRMMESWVDLEQQRTPFEIVKIGCSAAILTIGILARAVDQLDLATSIKRQL